MNIKEEIKLRDEALSLLKMNLTEEDAKRIVEIIKLLKDDDEVAHSLEDELREVVLKSIDHPLAKIALLTNDIDFRRWCA